MLHICLKNNLVILDISGETTQKGFYIYDKNRKAKPDPEIKKYIEKARSMSGISMDPKVSLSLFTCFNISDQFLTWTCMSYGLNTKITQPLVRPL